MEYREEYDVTKGYKEQYVDEIERLILERQRIAAEKREEYCKNIFADPEPYRQKLREILGWPLVDNPREGVPKVKAEKLFDGDGYTAYRMQVEILDGVNINGLYYQQNCKGKRPLVLVQHGGWGTPEIISGFYGETTNYHEMLMRVVRRGMHVFAPQLLLWRKERYNVEYDRARVDAMLKQVGGSITALEVYGLMRILDYFETKDNVLDFGMVGLSYGGFYTLFTSAVDTRIKSSISCAYFNTRDKYNWTDWTWFGMSDKFDDSEIACLIYPRKLCIELGTGDTLFKIEDGKRSYERIREMCSEVGTDWLEFVVFDGVHEFCPDDGPIDRFRDQLFGTEM